MASGVRYLDAMRVLGACGREQWMHCTEHTMSLTLPV